MQSSSPLGPLTSANAYNYTTVWHTSSNSVLGNSRLALLPSRVLCGPTGLIACQKRGDDRWSRLL